MFERPNTLRVRINNAALVHNYKTLQLAGTTLMPVLKADAYGHGLLGVGRLLEMHGVVHLGVGVVREGRLLRRAGATSRIYALLGALTPEDAAMCRVDNITPLVYSHEQLDILEPFAYEPMDIALKVDSGMSRLGFSLEELPGVLDHLAKIPHLRPVLLVSHLATADSAPHDPGHQELLGRQQRIFEQALAAVREKFPKIRASLANSAACIGYPSLHYDIQRPGLALYGVDPLAGTPKALSTRVPEAALVPAMEASAPILQERKLKAGDAISYGATFVADRPMRVAIIAAGYAEMYSRGLTGKACVTINGQRAPLVGRVCMQMCVADVSYIPEVEAGQWAYLLGGPGHAITPELLAEWWGTIPYEPMCLFGYSAQKEYY